MWTSGLQTSGVRRDESRHSQPHWMDDDLAPRVSYKAAALSAEIIDLWLISFMVLNHSKWGGRNKTEYFRQSCQEVQNWLEKQQHDCCSLCFFLQGPGSFLQKAWISGRPCSWMTSGTDISWSGWPRMWQGKDKGCSLSVVLQTQYQLQLGSARWYLSASGPLV